MKSSDLTESEQKVWQAAATGAVVDLRVGDSQLDSPEKWAEWGEERTVQAEVIADLLIGDGDAASKTVRGVRLQGARITGDLNLEAATLQCPLALLDCSFATAINLNEATAVSVRLSGSHVPSVRAQQLRTRGDLRLNKGFSVSGGVKLAGAHIGGDLNCEGGQCSSLNGPALLADRLAVDGDMLCRNGFSASGEVNLQGAHIGGALDCEGGQFSNPNGRALLAQGTTVDGGMLCRNGFSATGQVILSGARIGGVLDCKGGHFSNAGGSAFTAEGLTVDGSMYCSEGFSATGEVNLLGAHINGQLDCTRGQFSNPDGDALSADGLTVERDMYCRQGFSASGEVRLLGAHISGQLDCTGGQFSNPDGDALNAFGLTVDGSMYCSEGFSATGRVNLLRAHISGVLNCRGGQFSKPGGEALRLWSATVSSRLRMESAVLQGILDLTDAKASSYHDNPTTSLQKLRLDGFVYDAIEGATAKERLQWLRRNEKGYSPQIYDQLASVYRRTGHDEDARRILIAKQRRRLAERNLLWRLGGYVLDGLVGYGYRTWLAAFWLVGFLILGTWLFGSVYRGDLSPVSQTTVPPPFQPFFYTLDLLLPVVSLHVRDAWIAQGAAQVWSVIFIIMGWILATAVVLSLTGLLKRD